jgi:hypothetical protein
MTKATINVTDKHIRRGVRGTPNLCPIAIATREALQAPRACVCVFSIDLIDENGSFYASTPTPMEGWRFIEDFDAGRPVKPFSFEATFFPYDPDEILF